jgi:hypothetical protein
VITYAGGVQIIGPIVKIPGRTLDVDHLDEAEQHAAAVLAAIRQMRTPSPAVQGPVAAGFACPVCPDPVDVETEHVTITRQAEHDRGGACSSRPLFELVEAHLHARCFERVTAGQTDLAGAARALFSVVAAPVPAAVPR